MLYQLSYTGWMFMVEERGFEPLKAKPADLQSAPFDHSGTPPQWSRRSDLNGRPADYKSAALPTELRQHFTPNLERETGIEPATYSLEG